MGLVTLPVCDPCTETNQSSWANTHTVVIDDGPPLALDLCGKHERPLLDLRALLEEYGHNPDSARDSVQLSGDEGDLIDDGSPEDYPVFQPAVALPEPAAIEPDDEQEEGFACTVKGCGHVSRNPQGLGAHKRKKHGILGAKSANR